MAKSNKAPIPSKKVAVIRKETGLNGSEFSLVLGRGKAQERNYDIPDTLLNKLGLLKIRDLEAKRRKSVTLLDVVKEVEKEFDNL